MDHGRRWKSSKFSSYTLNKLTIAWIHVDWISSKASYILLLFCEKLNKLFRFGAQLRKAKLYPFHQRQDGRMGWLWNDELQARRPEMSTAPPMIILKSIMKCKRIETFITVRRSFILPFVGALDLASLRSSMPSVVWRTAVPRPLIPANMAIARYPDPSKELSCKRLVCNYRLGLYDASIHPELRAI